MTSRRLYVRGLPPAVTETDLMSRFMNFGAVSNVEIAKDVEGQCRGFGHFTLECEDQEYSKCQTVLNGSSWKGSKIHIEPAKVHYKELMQKRNEESAKLKNKVIRGLARHAADMTLVDEKNVDGRKGWRRGKFGRPIAIVKLRKPDGTLVVMDPSHDIASLEKFYEGFRQRPSRSLTWFSSDVKSSTSDVVMEDSHYTTSEDDEMEHELVADVEMTELQPESIEESAQAKSWDQVVAGGGFSLSLALNLPVSEAAPQPTIAPTVVREAPIRAPVEKVKLSKLLFNFMPVFERQDQNDLFMLHGSRMESVTIWKAGRSDIRKDFKKQAKAAKRYARKRHNVAGKA